MTRKELYEKLFTEYPGSLGYGPAVITLAIGLGIAVALGIGGYTIGKQVLAAAFGIGFSES
jgi:hypothetical protein